MIMRALIKVSIILIAVVIGVLRSKNIELSIISIVIALAFIFSAFYLEKLGGAKN